MSGKTKGWHIMNYSASIGTYYFHKCLHSRIMGHLGFGRTLKTASWDGAWLSHWPLFSLISFWNHFQITSLSMRYQKSSRSGGSDEGSAPGCSTNYTKLSQFLGLSWLHSFQRYSLSTYNVPGTGQRGAHKTRFWPSENSYSRGDIWRSDR